MAENQLQIIEHEGKRVVTTKQLADAYGTDIKNITRNFNNNKDRFCENKHYFALSGNEKQDFINRSKIFPGSKNAKHFYLWTEKGALLIAKSINTDTAWAAYERLVDFYFEKKEQLQIPMTTEDKIKLLAQGNVELTQKVDQVTENVENLKEDLTNFRMDLPILPLEADRITYASKKRGVDLLGGKNSPAYNDKKLRMKLYKNLYKDLKYQFNVTSYKQIKRSQCEKAIAIINEYEPPYFLAEEIANTNAQQSFI